MQAEGNRALKLIHLLPALALAALVFFNDGVSVETISAVMKRVTVGPRSYLVTRLGSGVYNVTTTDAKASLSFGQNGIHSELGNVNTLNIMRRDVQRFPKDLFT
jgi:hypothetical protein